MGTLIDLTGRKYNRWTILAFVGIGKHSERLYKCQCECGTMAIRCGNAVKDGHTKSCGCLRAERAKEVHTIHGEATGTVKGRTKEFKTWIGIKARTNGNLNNKWRQDYFERGITVCDRWKNNYEAFLEDMGRAPTKKHSIDRINNNQGYEPGNCRWATSKQQLEHKRRPVFMKFKYIIEFAISLGSTEEFAIQWFKQNKGYTYRKFKR